MIQGELARERREGISLNGCELRVPIGSLATDLIARPPEPYRQARPTTAHDRKEEWGGLGRFIGLLSDSIHP